MLRLVVVPCLNAHKRHVRDPPPFPITLPGPYFYASSSRHGAGRFSGGSDRMRASYAGKPLRGRVEG